jgi:hypothetical protein
MPYDGQKIPFPRLQKYLSGVIAWHPTDLATHSYVRQGVKWFFDLVKNALVAGALKFLATRSDSLLIKIASDVAFYGLLFYCVSYVQSWHLHFFHPWWPARWAKTLDLLISILVITPLFYVIAISVPSAIDEIAKAQVK